MKNAMFGLSETGEENFFCQCEDTEREREREGQSQHDLKFVTAQIEEKKCDIDEACPWKTETF